MSGSKDPSATDLDYYSKPENYEGSSLQAFKKFQVAKEKEDKSKQVVKKERKVKDEKYYFFHRYKHILKDAIFISDLLEREKEESSEEEEEEEVPEEEAPQEKKQRETTKSAGPTMVAITEEDESTSPAVSRLDVRRQISHRSAKSIRSLDVPSPEKSTSATTSVSGTLTDDIQSMSPDSFGFVPPRAKKSSLSAGRQSAAFQRAKMSEMERKIRAKELKRKFKQAGHSVKCICRLAASARGKQSSEGASMRTFMDIAAAESSTADNMKNMGLSFDPSYYKAKKEISLSAETKGILTTPSELRTPEQVQTAMFGLQSLRSYAEYPLHMQEKLAKVAWYEVVAPKRIIIRQGHMAENFYFVLSGHAVVTILLRNPQTGASFVKTATVMKKGMSFGELALLHHSKRTATVTSQDQVQLLSIGREDFFDIFMAGQGEDNLPDHVRFISNLEFMKDWPIQLLVEHPEHCLLHFYKRNTTIVPDSNKSEWMYIIKSGSCQVLKKLKGVTAQCRSSKRPSCEELQLPNFRCIVFEPKVDSGLRKRKTSSNENKDNEKQSQNDGTGKSEETKDIKFSKEAYSNKPPTKKVHFSMESSFAKRKEYNPPEKSKPKKPETPKEPPASAKLGPVFVQVSNMKPRDVFGLDTVEFDDDIHKSTTTVSLISRGAECVMLSKEFFAKHANELVKKRIRHMVRPYPDEDVFQDNFQIKEDWNLYKKVMLNDLTSQMKSEKELADRFHEYV